MRIWVKQTATGKIVTSDKANVIRALAEGRITPKDQVAITTDGPWIPVGSVVDLAQPPLPPAPEAISPPTRGISSATLAILVIGTICSILLSVVLTRSFTVTVATTPHASQQPITEPQTTPTHSSFRPSPAATADEDDAWNLIQADLGGTAIDLATLDRHLRLFASQFTESAHLPECNALLKQVSFITDTNRLKSTIEALDRSVCLRLLESGNMAEAKSTLIDELTQRAPGALETYTAPALQDTFLTRLLDIVAEEARSGPESENDFIQCVVKLATFYKHTTTRLAELAAADMLESAKNLERRSLFAPSASPFNRSSKAVLAWPFYLHRIDRGDSNAVAYTVRPAVTPITIDPSNRTTLSFEVVTGGVGIEEGLNKFGGPARQLASTLQTNVIHSNEPQAVWTKWKPVWDGPTSRGINDDTTWFWIRAEIGDSLTFDELKSMLKAPPRAEINLVTPDVMVLKEEMLGIARENNLVPPDGERSKLSGIFYEKKDFPYFRENTKKYTVEQGQGRFRDVLARLKDGVKEWTTLASDFEDPSLQSRADERAAPTIAPSDGKQPPAEGHRPNVADGNRPLAARKHELSLDLRGDAKRLVKEKRNAKVFEEADGTTYWGPMVPNKMAEIVYEIPLPGRLTTMTTTIGVVAYNANHESGVVFDQGCGATLDVSPDGQTWIEIQRSVAGEPRTNRDIASVPEIRGTTKLYLRARLKITRPPQANGVRYSQFMRCNPSRDDFPKLDCVLD